MNMRSINWILFKNIFYLVFLTSQTLFWHFKSDKIYIINPNSVQKRNLEQIMFIWNLVFIENYPFMYKKLLIIEKSTFSVVPIYLYFSNFPGKCIWRIRKISMPDYEERRVLSKRFFFNLVEKSGEMENILIFFRFLPMDMKFTETYKSADKK